MDMLGETLRVTPLADFLNKLNILISSWILESWIPEVIRTIVNDPILLFTVGFLALGGVIGILGRLLSRS